MKTSTGVRFVVGIGLMTKVFGSLSLDFFLPAGFFFGVLRNDDLKLPFRGNFTIHDGGTMIDECVPGIFRFLWKIQSIYHNFNLPNEHSSPIR